MAAARLANRHCAGPLTDRLPILIGIVVVVQTAMVGVGVYGSEALRSLRFAGSRLLVAVSLAIIALALIDFLLPGATFWRSILLYTMMLAITLLVADRAVMDAVMGKDAFRRRVIVLGAGRRALRLRELSQRPGSGFTIVAMIAMGEGAVVLPEATERAAIDDLSRFVAQLGATEVVLALEERRNALPLKDLLRIKTAGVHVNDFASFMERETGRVDLDTLNPSWLIFPTGSPPVGRSRPRRSACSTLWRVACCCW